MWQSKGICSKTSKVSRYLRSRIGYLQYMVPKLREPRSLFAFNEEKKLQPPRWPAEMKVLTLRPRFIERTPKEPEPFWRKGTVDQAPVARK
ncbi:hypothetical protein QZH41_012694, partial [Actinostola sp. cb2023]